MLQGIRKGYTDVHYIIDNVELAQGKNVIKAVASYKGEEYTDEIEWVYTHEHRRSADSSVNSKEHAGW